MLDWVLGARRGHALRFVVFGKAVLPNDVTREGGHDEHPPVHRIP